MTEEEKVPSLCFKQPLRDNLTFKLCSAALILSVSCNINNNKMFKLPVDSPTIGYVKSNPESEHNSANQEVSNVLKVV